MAFDVARVRGLFPALGDGWVHLAGPEAMQIPEQVATAVASAMRSPVSGTTGFSPAAGPADAVIDAARRAVADLVGVDPAGVVLGPSPAVLLARLAEALSESWQMGDEIVVSRLDNPSNVAPWCGTAQRAGATVRWGEIDIETCELPAWQYDSLITSRTRLVALTAASSAVGTRPDLARISRAAHAKQALMVVDAHAAAAFQSIDVRELGVDVLALAAQAWGGPPVGALAFADASMLDRLPSCALTPHARGPERLELGPHAHPMLAGLVASVDYLAGLDDATRGTRRERLRTSMASMREYQMGLFTELIAELRWQGHVTLIGDPRDRVPVVAFAVTDRKASQVVDHLATRGVCVSGDTGRDGVFGALGVAEIGGAVRIGLGHYTSLVEVTRLSRAVSELR